MMIIRDADRSVDVELISLPAVTPPFAWRRGLLGSAQARTTAVLRITTEAGAVGEAYHEWSGLMLDDIVERVLRQELVGQLADRREWLWHRLWELHRTEEFPLWLIGVVDSHCGTSKGACWVFRCIACSVLPGVDLAYASTVTFSTAEEYLDVADQRLSSASPRSSSTLRSSARCSGTASSPS